MKRFDIKVNGTYIEDDHYRVYDDKGQYADGHIASELQTALEMVIFDNHAFGYTTSDTLNKIEGTLVNARGEP